MREIVTMLMICFIPQRDGTLAESWRFERQITLENCLIMNQIAAQGGKYGVITVRCFR